MLLIMLCVKGAFELYVNRSRKRRRQRKTWEDNIKKWTGRELIDTLRKAGGGEE